MSGASIVKYADADPPRHYAAHRSPRRIAEHIQVVDMIEAIRLVKSGVAIHPAY